METVLFILIGLVFGILPTYLWLKNKKSETIDIEEVTILKNKIQELEVALKTKEDTCNRIEKELDTFKEKVDSKVAELRELSVEKAMADAKIQELKQDLIDLKVQNVSFAENNKVLNDEINALNTQKAEITVHSESRAKTITELEEAAEKRKGELEVLTQKYNQKNEELAIQSANNKALQEKLTTQKEEIEAMSEKFNREFKNIASEILKSNTESFSETNKEKLKVLLDPLAKNIDEFKTKVQDVYEKEAKERFSLGEEVKRLAEQSNKISQDAINLTNALKGEAKTQGNWGEMILESILEKSGLRKDEEYFMEHQLMDENNKPLRSDSEGKKMRPDAVIKYPDNRNVIIDSKVSLNAYTRYMNAIDVDQQKVELDAHVAAIKIHIDTLSSKGYDDYDKTLDFVMMFIPSEPAYIAAMQANSDLWSYAYNKRILLMNPTNLITSLKLIVDLWKREYQNQNAIAIAERGAKLYDKFVGFTENLEKLGKQLSSAQSSYDDAYNQLASGNDNLVLQATKLKKLGVKNKKELKSSLENDSEIFNLTE